MFRSAIKAHRRIIPASGFYEWAAAPGSKQPHIFNAAAASPMLAFAGLWDRWLRGGDLETGEEIFSCTMIVSGASAWMEPYHDRMPILLMPARFDRWLSGEMGADELQPAAESALRERPVTARLNRTGYGDEDPTIIVPI